MAQRALVSITGDVLRWAVDESGLTTLEVSRAAGVDEAELLAWMGEASRPSITQTRKLASSLHRQVAFFLLPRVPESTTPAIEFRHPIGQSSRQLSPVERRYLRRARRLQETQAWLLQELERDAARVPSLSLEVAPDDAASQVRSLLAVGADEQFRWRSASEAFDRWRNALEAIGVTVVQFAMGERACRGFSIWDETVPLIAVNTTWRDEARIYTLFHELGHLVTRTNSACSDAPETPDARDPVERWCEEFGAAVLMPRVALGTVAPVADVAGLRRVAARFKVSLRAMAIRLIGLGQASWTLYREIPATSDAKSGGGGGTGRNRSEIRVDEIGPRSTEIFVTAVQRDIISESQALDYMDIPAIEFERLRDAV